MDRNDVGSWLGGPPLESNQKWPGERLGLPRQGPNSIPGLGTRFLALLIDWLLCYAVATAFFGGRDWAILLIFLVFRTVLIATLGFTIGHRLCGLRVGATGGEAVTLWKAFVRTALQCLVLPAVLLDPDRRGANDKLAGLVVVRF